MPNARLALLSLASLVACGGGRYKYAEMAAPAPSVAIAAAEPTSSEEYKDPGRNPWVDASKDHLSTFAADVDTASYTFAHRPCRRQLASLQLAARDRVRRGVD